MTKTYFETLSTLEKKVHTETVKRLELMRDQRERPDKEKNNLTYIQSYELNREADLAYSDLSSMVLKDDEDGAITKKYEMTSGATRSKDTSLVSHLNSFNFEPDIVAFDKDSKIVYDLGEATQDLIKKSLYMERWSNKQIDAQREFISQGNVFIREVVVRTPIVIHGNGTWKAGDKIKDYVEDKNPITRYEYKMERQLILGKNVFLSNIRERDIQKQSEVATWEEMSLQRAMSIYGGWDRWNFVEETVKKECKSKIEDIIQEDSGDTTWATNDYWNLQKPEQSIGILHLYNGVTKTYQIFLNGIMMLPIGYSIYEVSPSGLIPMAK